MISSLVDLLGCNLYAQKYVAPQTDSWYDWYPKKKKKGKLSNRVTYSERYDNQGYAYVNGSLIGSRSYDDDWDIVDEYNYEDDNLLQKVGHCEWCGSNVYKSECLEDSQSYCIGCDAIVYDDKIIKS
jgi:predicted phosphohydrolase